MVYPLSLGLHIITAKVGLTIYCKPGEPNFNTAKWIDLTTFIQKFPFQLI